MNCQEVRNLVERVLDRNLSSGVKRRFDLHLSRCEKCRAFIAAEQAEHQRWFKAVNSSEGLIHSLPPDFADRLAAAVTARSAIRRPFFMRLPRWALFAASLALMAGLVFANVKLIMEGGESGEANEALSGAEGVEATADIDDAVAVPSVSSVPYASSTVTADQQLANNQQREKTMSKTKAAGAALSAALAAAPLAAANGDGYKFIIEGDPVAAATAGSSSSSSAAAALAVGTLSDGFVYDSEFEARSRTTDDSNMSSLRSDPCMGMVLTFK